MKYIDGNQVSKEIIDELKDDFGFPKFKQNPIIMGLVNFCQKHVIAHVTLGLKLPETTATAQFDGTGVKEFVNYLLSDAAIQE